MGWEYCAIKLPNFRKARRLERDPENSDGRKYTKKTNQKISRKTHQIQR